MFLCQKHPIYLRSFLSVGDVVCLDGRRGEGSEGRKRKEWAGALCVLI